MYQAYYESEVGLLEITANQEGITSVIFVDERQEENKNEMIEQCINELDEYFKGKKKRVYFTRCLRREPHFKNVWMLFILFRTGVSASYLDIAEKVGNTKAVRAIGGANSRNPISIIVSMSPCNRKRVESLLDMQVVYGGKSGY